MLLSGIHLSETVWPRRCRNDRVDPPCERLHKKL